MGEMSSARQVLEGAELAPGSRHTLNTLQDQSRRPRDARVPIPPPLANLRPRVPFALDGDMLARNLRSAKRCFWRAVRHDCGAFAPTPQPHERQSTLLPGSRVVGSGSGSTVHQRSNQVGTPHSTEEAGRRSEGHRCRRHRETVARTISQQLSERVQPATAPFQYALSTRAQGITEMRATATITSVDGISAFDVISHRAMLEGLRGVDESVVPSVSLFYSSPSGYFWEDAEGTTHTIVQGREGGTR